MKILGVLLLATLLSFYEVPKMKKQDMKKELMLFSFLLSLSSILTILMLIGVTIPNPTEGLIRVFSPVGYGIESFFGEKEN